MHRSKTIVFNISFALNCLLLFLLLFDQKMHVPGWLQVVGRMHPLVLHFPIVLLVLCIFWELFLSVKLLHHEVTSSIGDGLLLSAAIASVITALMGLFLSKEGGYTPGILVWHKWAGVSISFLLLGWYAFRTRIRQHKISMVATSLISMVIIIITGHQGANITHGENFLLAPVMIENQKPAVLFEDALVFADVVHPILQLKCISCHNSKKAKGELVMENADQLLKGGRNGNLWDSTESDLGLLFRRIHLPEDSKKHMPPAGKPQLTNEEIEILYRWVKSGASFSAKVSELPSTDSLRILAATKFVTIETDDYTFAPADESKVKKLTNDYRVVQPLAVGSPALGVEFFGASQFKAEQLKELLDVKNQVVSLNLNKMPVADQDLKIIAQFINLRRLSLSFTNITGATLSELSRLKELRQLSLSGTKVQTGNLKALASLPKLSQLFVWNTSIPPESIKSIEKQLKNVTIETGFKGDTIALKLNLPLIENEEVVITKPIILKLKHYINGVTIRYTTDGTEPDSTTSPVYKNDVEINKSLTVKAKAFKKGWISSDVIDRTFFRSAFKPDSVRLLTSPNPVFKAGGGITIIDGQKGDLNFKAGKWLGYREQPMEALLYFDKPSLISSLTISGLVDIGAYIMPPKVIEVWGGESAGKMRLLKSITPQQPTMEKPVYFLGYDVSFSPVKEKLLKVVIRPVAKLPVWHRGKGEKAWSFVDEIFVN